MGVNYCLRVTFNFSLATITSKTVMQKLKIRLSLVALTIFLTTAQAENSAIRQDYITGTLSSFPFNRHKFSEVSQPLAIVQNTSLTPNQHTIVELAKKAFEDDSFALGIMMLERGQLLFEQFKKNTDHETKFFSYSMSKSLTAITVGQALCLGQFKSLDDRAGDYAKTLDQTVFGQATLRQLLTMSSGARAPDEDGGSLFGEWNDITKGYISIDDLLKKYGNEKANANIFSYNNSDTNALMLAVNGAGNFAQIFEQKVWKPSQPEQSATWLTDKQGQLYAAAGFGAVLRDWARLAMRSVALLKGADGPCMAEFMKQATTSQTSDTVKQRPWDYGYQIWVAKKSRGISIYAWQGAYGQSILIDPVHERIIIVFRHKAQQASYRAVGGLFARWASMPAQ
jgi:CubicO group peptidase (beta-lactamase class C family)